MPKDLREILKEAQNSRELQANHRDRFENRLQKLHTTKKGSSFFFLKIAASIVVVLGLSYGIFNLGNENEVIGDPDETTNTISLSSVSPEMKQIEDYYVAAINYEIASLEITPENQVVLDDYLEKIGKLADDYIRLNTELSTKGINEKTINALITNLQLRLQLLLQLKDTLNEMKISKNEENENVTI